LAKGVTACSGQFLRGEAVDLVFDNKVIARGLTQYSNTEIEQLKGLDSDQIVTTLGFKHKNEVIHRDDLVVYTI
jgi:glutamate 5-kinase